MNNIEKLQEKWARGELCVGTNVTFTDATVTELSGEAGFDLVWIECEHSAMGLSDALEHVRAARAAGIVPFIRVPSCDPVVVKPFLELHPAGIILPRINSVEDAEQAVKSCRYPPRGVRGYGPSRGVRFSGITQQEYIERVDQEMLVILQIEHIDAVNQIDKILEIPGVDSIVTGPNDLSATMGLFGQTSHPDVVAAVEKVYSSAIRKGMPTGHSTGYDPEGIQRWIDMGLSWICVDNDWSMLFAHSSRLVQELRGMAGATPSG
jgi:2-keto-3-deoxy-L-rhamnonate aldolase RhmA